MDYICPHCKKKITLLSSQPYHSGFANQGYLYCDKCSNTLVFNSFDSKYGSLIKEKHPWTLTDNEQGIVENNLVNCSCGGKFTFSAKPRCPSCLEEIPDITPLKGTEKRSISYVILGNLVDGDKMKVWKDASSPLPK